MNPTTALNSAIQELNHTIATLARCPETDQPATAALHSATTAQAHLRDVLAGATPADAPPLAAPTGEPGAFNLISELWERAAPDLDRETLAWFAGAIDQAENMAANLQESVEGIGCLMRGGTDCIGQAKAGNVLSGHDAPALLFAIAHVMDTIRALNLVGDAANHALWRAGICR
ncbi:MAG: hypothetical protein WC091_12870 [Sulfuricellaceae bacterium]